VRQRIEEDVMSVVQRTLTITAVQVLYPVLLSSPVWAAPDPWVTARVKIELLTADVGGMDIDVDTIDGRVTLHGVVESEARRLEAERLAAGVDGVSDVRNLLQVASGRRRDIMKRADGQLDKDVRGALLKDKRLADSNIGVQSVHDGVVLLAGRASSVSDHVAALQVAASVNGVRRVETEITSPDRLTDAELWEEGRRGAEVIGGGAGDLWITTKAKLKFLLSDEVPALDVNVDTDNGVVTLFGTVPTQKARQAATRLIQGVEGVQKVDNQLVVVPVDVKEAVAANDADLREEIEDRLARHAELQDADIHVDVKDGVVRLSGSVPSQTDRFVALTAARITRGARALIDDLKVEYRNSSRG
jgi:osmotically-inducible protein OsmY